MRRLLAASLLLAIAGCAAPVPRAVVFFSDTSTALDENGVALVRQAANAAIERPRRTVAVMGYASTDGDPADNRALAAARAQAVAAQLRRDGVAPERISVRPRGPVPFTEAPIESRRVEIVIDP